MHLTVHLVRNAPDTLLTMPGIHLAAGIPAWLYGRHLTPGASAQADPEDARAGQ